MPITPTQKMLKSPTKEVEKTFGRGGILARLFRNILKVRNVSFLQWQALMKKFITDPRNGVSNDRDEQTSYKGNLTKELNKPSMSFNVFLKAMRFLNFAKIEIIIRAYDTEGRCTEHMEEVNLHNEVSIEDFLNSQSDTAEEVEKAVQENEKECNEYA